MGPAREWAVAGPRMPSQPVGWAVTLIRASQPWRRHDAS